MAKIVDKVVTLTKLGIFKQESDKIYVAKNALEEQLSSYIKRNDLDSELSDYAKDTEVEEKLTPYLKSTDAEGKYATKDEVGNLGDLKGSCEKSELESKKEECKTNDMYIVTDDDNHIYYYNGEDFIDTAAKCHVDLTPYLKTADANGKFATTESLQEKADKTELESYIKEEELVEATEDEIKQLFSPE